MDSPRALADPEKEAGRHFRVTHLRMAWTFGARPLFYFVFIAWYSSINSGYATAIALIVFANAIGIPIFITATVINTANQNIPINIFNNLGY